jgi:hypothetical protein
MRRRRLRPQHDDEVVLSGLDPYPAPDSVRNMMGYDQCPPAVRQRIANHPHAMVFATDQFGRTVLIEIRQT